MLVELSVENIAIIDKARIDLSLGFTALTGETGAGKSLLIDSIGLALGGRADSDLVRAGARKGTVCLVADLRANPLAIARCADLGVDLEDGKLVVQRDVSSEGRSTVRLNGRPVTVGTLKEIGRLLVDLHGQHDHQALLHVEHQIDFLDSWIGGTVYDLIAKVEDQFSTVESLKRKLNAIRNGHREREQRIDMLTFQIEEITDASPSPGETEDLEARIGRLQNSEKLGQGVFSTLESLADDEDSGLVRLATSLRELDSLARLDPSLEDLLEPLRTAEANLSDGLRELRAYADSLEADPAALEETAARLDLLQKLKRKYGDTETAILDYLEQAEKELADLQDQSFNEEELVAQIDEKEAELQASANALTELRKEKSKVFTKEVIKHLRDLDMPKADFEVRFEKISIQPSGQDFVEYYFTSNPGEPPRPLSKVASGGELARVMLAIKVASAGRAGVPSLIFDEVDTGLSGRAAAITAKKIEELSRHYQVIVISHLPQIAGRSNTHFRIEKVEKSGRVFTQVRELHGEERVEEIARMLAGETIGESALANARELLL